LIGWAINLTSGEPRGNKKTVTLGLDCYYKPSVRVLANNRNSPES